MGREVRRVPANWQHPTDGHYANGTVRYVSLLGGDYEARASDWDDESAKWERGEFPDYADEENKKLTYSECAGERPKVEDYMPQWTAEEATHYMMYETTSEGSPISPAFATPEELAQWLTDTDASAFAGQTASYEGWLRVARGGFACSAVIAPGVGMVSGVDAL